MVITVMVSVVIKRNSSEKEDDRYDVFNKTAQKKENTRTSIFGRRFDFKKIDNPRHFIASRRIHLLSENPRAEKEDTWIQTEKEEHKKKEKEKEREEKKNNGNVPVDIFPSAPSDRRLFIRH